MEKRKNKMQKLEEILKDILEIQPNGFVGMKCDEGLAEIKKIKEEENGQPV